MTARALLAKVHIAKKELGLDDGTYRAVLERVTGRASAADCNDAQLRDVLDDFKSKGWKPKLGSASSTTGINGHAPHPRPADHPAAKKARALWISLHQLGAVRDPSEAALEAFARRQLHVEKLQWAKGDQVYRLIEALKAMAEREGWSQSTAFVDGRQVVVVLKRRLLEAIHRKLGTPAPPCAQTALDAAIGLAARELRERGP